MSLAIPLRTALRTASRAVRQDQLARRALSTHAAAVAHSAASVAAASAIYAASSAVAASCSAHSGAIAASSASYVAAPSAAAASPSCQTWEEARAMVMHVYGREMWERIQQRADFPSTSASASAAANQHRRTDAITATPPPPLLHVTSLFHPRSCSPDLYTLQVTGLHSPRHPLDRFALCLARSLAAEVVYSGKVLREEPHLRCEIDAAFAGGLGAVRALAAAPSVSVSSSAASSLRAVPITQPALSILTRASSLSDVVGGLDFAHPIWDAHDADTQPITVYHARSSFGASIRAALRRNGGATTTSTSGAPIAPGVEVDGDDEIEVPLASLVRAVHEEDALTAASSSPAVRPRQPSHLQLRHPHKIIRFRCTHNASALEVVQMMQAQTARRLAAQTQTQMQYDPPPSFLSQLSIEAGPQVTRSLYGDLPPSSSSSAAVLLRPPVQTLLLSVYRGAIPPEHYRRFLVYPSSHALAASNEPAAAAGGGAAAAAAATESSAPPAPTLTLPFLHRFYRQMSEYHCPRDKDWSFLWFERKD